MPVGLEPGIVRKPRVPGFIPGMQASEWGWFWDKSHAIWLLGEGFDSGITRSFGREKVEGTLQADALWTTSRFGIGLSPAASPTDPRVLVPDNSRFVFINDFSITVVFFDDGITPAGGRKAFCGKVSSNFQDYNLVYHHASQGIEWVTDGDTLLFGGAGGDLDFLHGILSTLTFVKHPVRGKEIWHNGDQIDVDATQTADLTTGTNTFALLARGSTSQVWDNGPIYGFYFHQPALTEPQHTMLSRDPFGPFEMDDEVLVFVAAAAAAGKQVYLPLIGVG